MIKVNNVAPLCVVINFSWTNAVDLEPIPAVSGRGQGTPWTSCPSLMAEAAMQSANCTSGPRWGSVSYSRTLQHEVQLSLGELVLEPATLRSPADLLYLSASELQPPLWWVLAMKARHVQYQHCGANTKWFPVTSHIHWGESQGWNRDQDRKTANPNWLQTQINTTVLQWNTKLAHTIESQFSMFRYRRINKIQMFSRNTVIREDKNVCKRFLHWADSWDLANIFFLLGAVYPTWTATEPATENDSSVCCHVLVSLTPSITTVTATWTKK